MSSAESATNSAEPEVCDVLVIEDDVFQACEIEAHLSRRGIAISKFVGGSESLHNVARIAPKVIIVDYHLPDIDGMTLAARIHRLAPNAAVILVSGRIDFVASEALDRFGVVAFFKKPLNLGALRRLVSKLLRNPHLTRKELSSPLWRLFPTGW
jgi:DNA-binding NtrC family response regulator